MPFKQNIDNIEARKQTDKLQTAAGSYLRAAVSYGLAGLSGIVSFSSYEKALPSEITPYSLGSFGAFLNIGIVSMLRGNHISRKNKS